MREACVFEHLGQADARIAFIQAHIVKPANMKVFEARCLYRVDTLRFRRSPYVDALRAKLSSASPVPNPISNMSGALRPKHCSRLSRTSPGIM